MRFAEVVIAEIQCNRSVKVFQFLAERICELIVGKRDMYHAQVFMGDLAARLGKRIQLSSDSLKTYADAVERGFGCEVDYGQISKTYSLTNLNNDRRKVRAFS